MACCNVFHSLELFAANIWRYVSLVFVASMLCPLHLCIAVLFFGTAYGPLYCHIAFGKTYRQQSSMALTKLQFVIAIHCPCIVLLHWDVS